MSMVPFLGYTGPPCAQTCYSCFGASPTLTPPPSTSLAFYPLLPKITFTGCIRYIYALKCPPRNFQEKMCQFWVQGWCFKILCSGVMFQNFVLKGDVSKKFTQRDDVTRQCWLTNDPRCSWFRASIAGALLPATNPLWHGAPLWLIDFLKYFSFQSLDKYKFQFGKYNV